MSYLQSGASAVSLKYSIVNAIVLCRVLRGVNPTSRASVAPQVYAQIFVLMSAFVVATAENATGHLHATDTLLSAQGNECFLQFL